MPLQVPEIDQRTYEDILNEAIGRIRIHNPEWNNYNDSDPGITLLQLFAFMTENLLYRARLIPDRNRVKFLSLLGVGLSPPEAARGMVAFENLQGPLTAVLLDPEQEVVAGKIPFRTSNGLAVLPVEGRLYTKARLAPEREAELASQYASAFQSFVTPETTLVLYEAKQVAFVPGSGVDLDVDTVDGSLWLALLARNKDLVDATRTALGDQVLTIGVVPEPGRVGRALPPGGSRARSGGGSLAFDIPNADEPMPTDPAERMPKYRPPKAVAFSSDVLAEAGTVQLSLPSAAQLRMWADLDPTESGVGDFPPTLEGSDAQRIVTWIRIRPTRSPDLPEQVRAAVRLQWVGINAAMAWQRTHVGREIVGRGTGEADQSYRLANVPVLTDTLTVTVAGETWTRVPDLLATGPEVRVGEAARSSVGYGDLGRRVVKAFTVDRESGLLTFGDGIHGARPPADALIEAAYDYGGGRAGVVGPNAITKGPTLPAGVKVYNPLPTWGGDEPMSVEEAERSISLFLHHSDRAVSAQDFEDIAGETPGVDMGRVEVLPLFLPEVPDAPAPGVVTVMVIPRYDPANPDTPEPDAFFLDLVCDHLDPRRLLTTEVHVRGPEYVPMWVSIGFDVLPGRDVALVRETVKASVKNHLSALTGGLFGTGWPLDTNVERLDLWAQANRVDGVARVNDVLLADGRGIAVDRVELSGLKLPRLAGVAVGPGDPAPLSDVRGDSPPASPALLPVPIDPAEC